MKYCSRLETNYDEQYHTVVEYKQMPRMETFLRNVNSVFRCSQQVTLFLTIFFVFSLLS